MTTHEQIKSHLSEIEQRENAAAIYGGGAEYIAATAHSKADVPKLRKALEMACQALESDKMYLSLQNVLTTLKS